MYVTDRTLTWPQSSIEPSVNLVAYALQHIDFGGPYRARPHIHGLDRQPYLFNAYQFKTEMCADLINFAYVWVS